MGGMVNLRLFSFLTTVISLSQLFPFVEVMKTLFWSFFCYLSKWECNNICMCGTLPFVALEVNQSMTTSAAEKPRNVKKAHHPQHPSKVARTFAQTTNTNRVNRNVRENITSWAVDLRESEASMENWSVVSVTGLIRARVQSDQHLWSGDRCTENQHTIVYLLHAVGY